MSLPSPWSGWVPDGEEATRVDERGSFSSPEWKAHVASQLVRVEALERRLGRLLGASVPAGHDLDGLFEVTDEGRWRQHAMPDRREDA